MVNVPFPEGIKISFHTQAVFFFFSSKHIFTWGTMFLKDSMILELLASWKYEKQPVMTTTAVSTIPRYNWRERERQSQTYVSVVCGMALDTVCVCGAKIALPRCYLCLHFRVESVADVLMRCRRARYEYVWMLTLSPAGSSSVAAWMA